MKKKTKVVLIIISILVMIGTGTFVFLYYDNYKKQEEKEIREQKQLEEIKKHYNIYIKTNKEANIYKKNNNKFYKVAVVSKNKEFKLKDIMINKDTVYLPIQNSEFYLSFKDVTPIDALTVANQRYKNYIPFNETIITKNKVNLYQQDKVIYSLDYYIKKPIIQKEDNGYYIEYDNDLFFIKKEEIKEMIQEQNSQIEKAQEVPVSVYHFFYKDDDKSCNEIICHSETQIREHFTYLNENKYFTLTTKELEYFIDEKINIPKNSILVTIDDGSRAEQFIPLLEEFQINATLFLVSSWYDKALFSSPFMEIASHTHDQHTPGKCPGGQGSPLKCLDKNILLEDLKKSRDALNQTEALCFPFYEYNDYAIRILKEAGFKTGYIGGQKKATIGVDKYKIPRITFFKNTTLDEYKKAIK